MWRQFCCQFPRMHRTIHYGCVIVPFLRMEPPSHSPIKVTSTQYLLQAAGPVRLQPTLPTTPNPSGAPDGKKLLFRIRPNGKYGYFEVNKEGVSQRLTTHPGNETPVAYKDAGHILFLANIMPTVEDAQFPPDNSNKYMKLIPKEDAPCSLPCRWKISVSITQAILCSTMTKKGYEDPWRKHHTSSITPIFGCVL